MYCCTCGTTSTLAGTCCCLVPGTVHAVVYTNSTLHAPPQRKNHHHTQHQPLLGALHYSTVTCHGRGPGNTCADGMVLSAGRRCSSPRSSSNLGGRGIERMKVSTACLALLAIGSVAFLSTLFHLSNSISENAVAYHSSSSARTSTYTHSVVDDHLRAFQLEQRQNHHRVNVVARKNATTGRFPQRVIHQQRQNASSSSVAKTNTTKPSSLSVSEAPFAACLLIKDDNAILDEWLGKSRLRTFPASCSSPHTSPVGCLPNESFIEPLMAYFPLSPQPTITMSSNCVSLL